jgi:hypothetical protein
LLTPANLIAPLLLTPITVSALAQLFVHLATAMLIVALVSLLAMLHRTLEIILLDAIVKHLRIARLETATQPPISASPTAQEIRSMITIANAPTPISATLTSVTLVAICACHLATLPNSWVSILLDVTVSKTLTVLPITAPTQYACPTALECPASPIIVSVPAQTSATLVSARVPQKFVFLLVKPHRVSACSPTAASVSKVTTV